MSQHPINLRSNDLDALRAFAMLLGIALHALLMFFPNMAPVQTQNAFEGPFYLLFSFIHSFRMPLFFMISGFFTALLWHRRGLTALVKHRTLRVLVPLFVAMFTIIPLTQFAAQWASEISGTPFVVPAISHVSMGAFFETFRLEHLWFLWILMILFVGFCCAIVLLQAIASVFPRAARHYRSVGIVLLPVIILASAWPQSLMLESIGPDTPGSLLPAPHIVGYYALFFAFGCLCYDRGKRGALLEALSVQWMYLLPISVFILFPAVFFGSSFSDHPYLAQLNPLVQVLLTWGMIFGLVGAFKALHSKQNKSVRYLSDASYWMYLAHLPLVYFAQGAISQFELNPIAQYILICTAVTAILLASYALAVRRTIVGALLNGRKRTQDLRIAHQTPGVAAAGA